MATLEEALQAQLQEAWQLLARQQEEITLLVEQNRLEWERQSARAKGVRAKLETLNRDLDRYTREELRDLFHAAKEFEIRLADLGAEREILKYKSAVLTEEAQSLARFGALVNGDVPAPAAPARDGRAEPGSSDVGALLLAQERERERLSQQLHDMVVQPLHHIVLRVELLQRLIRSDPAQAVSELEGIRPLATQLLHDARRAIFELRPMSLDDLGLTETLEHYTQIRAEQDGLAVELRTEGRPRPLAPAIATTVFRIVQAALDNVRDHAEVREASIHLIFGERELGLIVADAGRGCNLRLVEAASHGGTGLLGMRERARQIGGALHLDSSPGRGMTVRLSVPLVGPLAIASGSRRRTPAGT